MSGRQWLTEVLRCLCLFLASFFIIFFTNEVLSTVHFKRKAAEGIFAVAADYDGFCRLSFESRPGQLFRFEFCVLRVLLLLVILVCPIHYGDVSLFLFLH